MFDIDVTHNIVREQADHATVLMDGVASGRKPMQLICSPSGFAKTTIAMKRFRAHGIVPPRSDGLALKPWQRLVLEARPTDAIVLVRKLFECVQTNAAVLLLDDPGKIAHDEDSLDVLKTGFGAQRTVMLETREIARNEFWRRTGHASYNALIPPPRFSTRDLRFLWLSNTDFTDPKLRKMIAEHFDPLVARGLNPFRITNDAEHDNQAVFEWVLWLVTVKNLLRNLGFSYNESRKAVNFYISNAHRLHDLSPRRMELLASLFRENLPQQTLEIELDSHLSKTDLRPKLKVRSSGLLWPVTPFNTGRLEESEGPPKLKQRPQKVPVTEPPQPTPNEQAIVESVVDVEPIIPICQPAVEPIDRSHTASSDPAAVEPPIVEPVAVPQQPPPDPVAVEQPVVEPPAEVVVETILPEEAIPAEPVASVEYLPVFRKPPPNPAPDTDPQPAARQTPVSEPDPEPDPPAPASVIDPPPDTSVGTAQVVDTPAPESPLELPLAVVVPAAPAEPNLSPELTFGQAIRAVYALGDRRTCDRVTDILNRCPLEECDQDELTEVAQALGGCAEWHAEHVQSICHTFAQYADGTLLFCTDDEVLVWEGSENGLQVYRWDSVRNMMAPHIAEAARRWEAQQREEDTKLLLTKKLPAKRKLKAVKERIDRIIELKAARITEEAQRAIDHIRQMTDDDPRFSECTKLEQYINAVAGCLSSGSGSN